LGQKNNQSTGGLNMSNDNKPASSASKRLRQVSSHLALPADYADVREQIQTLRTIAATPDTSRRGYVRQKQAGKLWVRERLEQLLDPDSFEEIGSLSGTVTWEKTGPMREKPVSFIPSNNVQGKGKLRGRSVLLTADDFSLRSGHADGASAGKTIYLEKLALALKLPVVKLVDGSSGGGSVTTIRKEGWSYLPYVPMFHQVIRQLNEGIPNLGAIVGPAVCIPNCLIQQRLTRIDWTRGRASHCMPFLGHGSRRRRIVQRRPRGSKRRYL
jgi:acetyl-CoA carboxylase carboxyltransferase component